MAAFESDVRLSRGQRDWAVRCFWREFADMQMRYAAISAHLRQTRLPYTIGFEYLPEGIKVLDRWFPILKMEWVEGECRTAGQRKQEICKAVACYYAARYAEIAAAVQALSERQLERYREIERRLADASRDEPFHHLQLVEAQRDLEPLRRFTFVRYVLFVVTGIQSRD